MKRHEILGNRLSGSRAAGLGLTALLLTGGCGAFEHDYAGKGDEFQIYGSVDHVGDQSVTINLTRVEEAGAKRSAGMSAKTVPLG